MATTNPWFFVWEMEKRSQVTDSGSSNLPVPRREMVCMRLVGGHGEEPLDTPPKIHMEPENWWFVNVSPFFRWVFSSSTLVFGGVVGLISSMLRRRCGNDVDV